MVFFTCSYCGESVKKPAVAKHYQTKCRKKDAQLTCVDCLKDFKGNEYEAHTKCLTEDEKYSAKGFVPKPSQNKGERKQQAWQECIQTVLKKPTLKADERDFIRAISKYENVPRKKAKFLNFLNNACKQYVSKTDLIDRVWVEMESVFKEMTTNTAEESKPQKQEPKPVLKASNKTEENSVKKEKKRKRQAEEEKTVEEEKTAEANTETGKKDEKQKKKKQKQNEEKPVEGNIEEMAICDKPEKKKKKNRKRKADKIDQTEQTNSVADEAEPGKKKKKKKNDKVEENQMSEKKTEEPVKNKKKEKKPKPVNEESKLTVPSAVVDNQKPPSGGGDTAGVKKEKKAKKSENKENCEQKAPVNVAKPESQGDADKPAAKKKKVKSEGGADEKEKPEQFDWRATILQVLNSDGKNNKIQLQKLQKKVLKLHCQILNCEISEKKEKKFLKKLKEMPEIVMEKEFVVLKS